MAAFMQRQLQAKADPAWLGIASSCDKACMYYEGALYLAEACSRLH